MSEALIVQDRQFVALSPQELPAAQRDVIGWCRARIQALAVELREQRENSREAARMLWRNRWPQAIRRTQKQMVYYAKMKKALEAGYLIVPNFDVEVFAVRVQRPRPLDEVDVHAATPELLPPGRGRYVDDTVSGRTDHETYIDASSKQEKTRGYFHPESFDAEIDFPAQLVKPSILAATDRAMAQRLFDRMGIVRQSKRSDPIVVGQIIHPKTPGGWQRRHNPTCVTFFVAWWLDTRDL